MAERKPAKKGTRKTPPKTPTAPRNSSTRFTAEERAAMKETRPRAEGGRANEAEAEQRRARERSPRCRDRIAPWPSGSIRSSKPARRPLAEDLVRDARVCQGRQGRLLLPAALISSKTRYATFGFNDAANLDKGAMWPIAFALTELTAADEKKIAALVKKAVR